MSDNREALDTGRSRLGGENTLINLSRRSLLGRWQFQRGQRLGGRCEDWSCPLCHPHTWRRYEWGRRRAM